MATSVSTHENIGNQIISIKDCLRIIGIEEIANNVYALPHFVKEKSLKKANKK
ncbi:MAG: hypothetical protein IPH28_02635 [Cytophagaceae bacterium]|jgi:hypothetical protein|nr:hypothetical protein [Cytophagaceae bacterium]MBK9512027.1 hypothetical protein [Cytophagaceae bacterium]MBK9934971.1 hypothetical protein [Cytophagaceae bacterium]MBL0301409.1 hypothetical protein [Cytophagaceae bacterium]MBL0324228.1 hypothetical protein [Cytophagaceae bacterium]